MISLEKQTIKLAIIDYNMLHVRVENKTHISVYYFEKVEDTTSTCFIPTTPLNENYLKDTSSANNKYTLKWELPKIPSKLKKAIYAPPSTVSLCKASSINGIKPEDFIQKELVIELWKQCFVLSSILHRNKRRRESIRRTFYGYKPIVKVPIIGPQLQKASDLSNTNIRFNKFLTALGSPVSDSAAYCTEKGHYLKCELASIEILFNIATEDPLNSDNDVAIMWDGSCVELNPLISWLVITPLNRGLSKIHVVLKRDNELNMVKAPCFKSMLIGDADLVSEVTYQLLKLHIYINRKSLEYQSIRGLNVHSYLSSYMSRHQKTVIESGFQIDDSYISKL